MKELHDRDKMLDPAADAVIDFEVRLLGADAKESCKMAWKSRRDWFCKIVKRER